jgi:hypothetical protein
MNKSEESILLRAGRVLILLFNVAFFVMALYFVFKGGVRTEASSALEYKDFISILLTGLSVMIAVGAILIAVLAIWSYSHFRTLAIEAAEKTAKSTVDGWLADQAPSIIRKHVDLLKDTSLGSENDEIAADEIGKGA